MPQTARTGMGEIYNLRSPLTSLPNLIDCEPGVRVAGDAARHKTRTRNTSRGP